MRHLARYSHCAKIHLVQIFTRRLIISFSQVWWRLFQRIVSIGHQRLIYLVLWCTTCSVLNCHHLFCWLSHLRNKRSIWEMRYRMIFDNLFQGISVSGGKWRFINLISYRGILCKGKMNRGLRLSGLDHAFVFEGSHAHFGRNLAKLSHLNWGFSGPCLLLFWWLQLDCHQLPDTWIIARHTRLSDRLPSVLRLLLLMSKVFWR